ncbi:AhpC/TSA family protein [Mucilaginibacter terrigena]|uniref:AhpC/TSA family protein n=1 Tax=Mucilaginibacter terrigena TaxID=2492395 RepID=A0A4Q5LM23_9SPHI|nr:TlpA disulfide reductase family protein [Mucilaginibacter terrigena]RYU90163.1 AhpC/TSA family protein [Mucilaginibacter terrigena]
MKRKLWLLFPVLLCNLILYARPPKTVNNFILKGAIANRKIHQIWLRYNVNNGKKVRLKTFVKNGSFLFRGFIASPVYAEFFFDNGPHSDLGFNSIFLSPGSMTVSLVKDDTEHTKVSGSVMQDDWYRLRANMPKPDSLFKDYGKWIEQNKQLDYNFIATHPASYLSPYLAADYSHELPLDSAEMFYNAFTTPVKNSYAGKAFLDHILKHKASAAGSMAPLFVKTDINKKQVDLRSFRNKKYVVLYFWASWALYRSNEVRYLNTMYKSYHSKGLEFIALSQDFITKDFREAIVKNGMGKWHNILLSWDPEFHSKYNINSMPPCIAILIDKQGKIIGRYMGEHPKWEKKLDNEGSFNDMKKKLAEVLRK